MSVVIRKLVTKELYLNRWFLIGAAVAGCLSAFACAFGATAFNIGALSWLTTLIGLGVMLAIYGVHNERKEQSLQFVLSLPIAVGDYVRAKLFGLLTSFVAAWLPASLAAIAMVLLAPQVPDGLLPFLVLLSLFLLANFSVVLAAALTSRSEAMMTTMIVVTNMGVSIYIFTVGALPSLRQHMDAAQPVWNDTFFFVLACELLLLLVAIALPLATAARRRDFL